MVDRLCNFITAHVKLVVSSNGDGCQQRMDKIVLKTICKTCFLVLETAKHFNTANSAYHAVESKRHDDINDSKCFIVYLDITKLYPSCMECIDALDRTKIYLLIQPKPTLTATNTDGGAGTDIDRLAATIEQQYKDAHDLKKETLVPYDLATGRETPTECIDCHDKY